LYIIRVLFCGTSQNLSISTIISMFERMVLFGINIMTSLGKLTFVVKPSIKTFLSNK